jgi:hypothetical protein
VDKEVIKEDGVEIKEVIKEDGVAINEAIKVGGEEIKEGKEDGEVIKDKEDGEKIKVVIKEDGGDRVKAKVKVTIIIITSKEAFELIH